MVAAQAIRAKKSPNTIQLENGRVVKLSEYVLWNGVDWRTVFIERREGDFLCNACTPDGGGTVTGTLDEVLTGFHPAIAADYRALFMLDEPTGAELRASGFGS